LPRRERNSLRYDSVTGEYVTQEELNRRIAERQKKHTFVDKSPLTKNTYGAQKSTGIVSNSPLLKNTYADRGLDSSRYIDYSKPDEISANKTTLPKQTPLYIDSATGDKVSLEEWNRRRQARLHADYSKPEELKSITQKSNISSSDKKYIDYNTGEKVTLEEWNRRRADAEQRKKTEEYYDNLKTERRELERATQRKDFYLNATKGREKEFGSFNSLKNYLTSQTNTKRNPLEFIKQKEKDVYDYYVGKGQEATAASYLDAIMPELNKRMTERATREAYEFGQEHKILSYPAHAAGSVGAGITALLETGRQAISNELTGKFVPVDQNSAAMLQQNKQDALAYGLTENYGPWGKFFAETGLSIASMATILPLGKIGSLAVMSSNAGGSTALNALNNGASPNQALTLGVTSAVIEAATEKIGLDNLFKLAGKPTKAIARAIASQVGAEGLEETISQYANHIADMGIMGENSEYNRYIKELERVGFTREQAEHDAKRKFLLQDPLKALLGGAISGGVFGGVGASVGNYQTDASTQNTEKPMVSYGVDVDTETKTFLEKVANKTGINIEVAEIYDKNGKQMSNAEGYYDRSQNKMVFAPDTSKSDVIKGVVMHELTHSIEGSKFYNEYVKFAINTQYKGAEDFKSAIQDKIQQYAKQNIELKPIDAQKELVAEITRNTIYDEAAINKLVAEKPNIAVQIYESIVRAIDTAKAYLTGDTETLELEKARRLFEKALNDRGVDNGFGDTDIKYSVKDDKPQIKRSKFYDNTIKRATAIPQEIKEKLNPESFDFIPESSKEWQKQAEKNVNADMNGVIERLKNAPSISGGIEGHEAAVVSRKIVGEIMKANDDEGNKLNNYFVMVASKTRESARALKATDTAWDKTEPAAAIVRAHREIQKVTDNEKKRNPKKFADAESEKKQLKTKMKNAEKLAQKDKAQKKLSDEQTKKIEDKRKKQMLERWVKETVPRAKQKNMLEKIQEMYEAGAYNDEALARLVSEKRDIPYLSLDEVKKIINYIDKANNSEEGSYEQRMAFSRAEQIIESKMPVTARDKIKAFPRISILTGTRTQIRNIVGNITHGTYEAVRENTIGLLTDIITSKFTGERKLTGNVIGKTSAYMKGFNMGVSEWYKDIKNKVDTSPTRTRGEVKRNSRTFNSAFLNAIDSVVKKGLSLGDRPFYQGAYEARMYELAKLNEKAKNKMSIDEMVLDAQVYALDKVYQNDSTVKKVATRLRNVSTAIDNPFWQSVVEVGMTVTVPFTETPANIFDKVLENSPIGLAKAAVELGKTKKGTFDQMKFVQSLSRGMTGTGLMALGAMLFSKGIIAIVPWDEEYDKYKFLQSMGVQNYALKVGNKYYSLSWLEPLATPLLVGAEIARGSDNDKNMIENLFGTTKIAIDSFFESSFVQGISELFSSDSIGEGVAKKLLDAHSMFTPLSAFSKALAQWADPYIRETKADNTILQMLKERASETPFLSKTLPTRIDVFGNEVKTLDGENHVFNVFFNPANVTDYVTTEVHDEIIRLYDETKEVTVFPDYISKREVTYDKNKVTLDEKQFEKYKREIGSNLYDEYEKLFKTEAYKNMSPEDKVKAIQSAKSDIKNQSNFNAVKNNEDFLSALTQDKQMYNDKTQLKLDADYATRWEKLTPNDNKVVKDARLLSAVKSAVNAFEKDGLLNKDNMAKISKYVENKRKREPTMMDVNLAAVYRATGDTSVYNGSYNNLIEFTSNGMPYKINYPAGLLLELIARSDSAVLAAYSKIMTSTKWLYMTPVQKQKALTDAKADARAAFEKELKIKYGARLDTTNKKWQAMTPQEKAAAANKGYKIN
jgi:hypothetical protein